MTQEKVLDHGYVRLVEKMGSDLSVVRAARVSFDGDWRTGADAGKDEKLISYLLANKHTSPFECVAFTFEIKCPIFIARQWHRHRTWKYNEVSARYTELPEEFYIPDPTVVGKQHAKNKQAREIPVERDASELAQIGIEADLLRLHCKESFRIYHFLMERGWPRELARSALPVNTFTRFFGTVDLHNLFHFLSLRDHSHAQYEAREYAKAIIRLIEPIVPVSVGAWQALRPTEGH